MFLQSHNYKIYNYIKKEANENDKGRPNLPKVSNLREVAKVAQKSRLL